MKTQNHLVHITVSTHEEDAELLLHILQNIKIIREIQPVRENRTDLKYHYDITQANFDIEDIEEIIQQFPIDKKWTWEDIENPCIFPPDLPFKIEIIDYQIFIMDPSTRHQKILTRVSAFMQIYALTHQLGDVYVAPVSLKISEGVVLKPDILYISVHKKKIVKERGLDGAPDLVVEVISKSNYKKLREQKKQLYADFGVQEYWEIYPKKKKISIETLAQTENEKWEYQTFSEATKSGNIKSRVLEGFELTLEQVFAE
ncbi:MAG: Uma2 family endonuclease [Microscillaceae bacterium]|nr:Uma2 family endonuclease [Microscillaceae bacterium]